MQAAGERVLRLNTGNPGQFGFGMPGSVRGALLDRMEKAVPYCDARGLAEAREAVCAYHLRRGLHGVEPEDVLLGNGVSEVAAMLVTALISPGDEMLLPCPCYSLWSNSVRIGGGRPVFYRCRPEDGWNPDPQDVERRVTGRTKAILLIHPNNPTGAVYDRGTLLAVADIARRHGLLLIADEIYDRLTLPGVHHESIGALAPDVPCVTLNGLSKSHVICGFRCGWMVFSGPGQALAGLRRAVLQLAAMRLCGNVPAQLVVAAALADERSTRSMMQPGGRLYEQRSATLSALSRIEGVQVVANSAAFYLFPRVDDRLYAFADDQEFAWRFLHEERILVIPGSGFEWRADLRFRIVMLPSASELGHAMEQLAGFLARHRRKAADGK